MAINKKRLKKRSTFEEVLQIVKEDKPLIQDLPNRFASEVRDSQKYQNLISSDLTEIEEHANRGIKHRVLQESLRSDI